LVRASFVPDRAQRELRELTRYRMTLVRERTAVANRLQKILEGANITLASVATAILGVSGREILRALVDGEADPALLAEHARGRLRNKLPELQRALAGCFGDHQRFMVKQQLAHVDFLETAIAQVSAEVATRLQQEEAAIAHLDTIPGIGRPVAEALLAELGTDMSRFPSAEHLASWAGMCPGNNESAGKQRSGKTRHGSPWLRALLVQAAHAAARKKGTYLAAQYRRIAARRGKSRAAVAVGHSILIIAYHLLQRGTDYEDLGPNYFDERDRQATQRRLVHRLEGLGYKVSLEPTQAA
jgi:transposase